MIVNGSGEVRLGCELTVDELSVGPELQSGQL